MKYDLYQVLTEAGYSKQDSNYGDIISKRYQGLYSPIKVEAIFSQDHSVVTFKYYNGGKREFKNKTHLNEKRAYNALRDTLKNSYVKEV